ncbi:MAG: transglycosylase SLT domain-containing protein [Gemmatimonadetes bacterium]|nr:transglycosylase SLT domain-containing protein [Gemmatimonadota bacterium]
MIATSCPASTSAFPSGLRHPALLALVALCAWVVPASATPSDTLRIHAPTPPRLDSYFGRDFWERLREEARRFRELEFGSFFYARRYEISPELAKMIHEEARGEGIDPELAFRLVRAESRFSPSARSRAGAMGLTQLMPGTARLFDRRMRSEEALLDPRSNLRVGFRYLRTLIERYEGDVRLALLAYNRGENAVDRALRRGSDPENGYSRRVLGTRGDDPYRGSGLAERTR